MLTRLAVCAAMGAARLLELCRSRRNVVIAGPTTEGAWSRRIYPLVVMLHATVIAGTLLRGGRARPGWLVLLLSVQPLRVWVLRTLGARWNARGAVPYAMQIATEGPYALIRHPNYLVVLIELLALPLAFGLARLAVLATIANAALLALRVREEERALLAFPAYRAHFERKRRFIPGLL